MAVRRILSCCVVRLRANTEYLFTSPNGGEPLWVLSHPVSPANGVHNHKPDTLRRDLDQKERPENYIII